MELRFIVGGLVVSFVAVIGDALKPKSFAGLFGAAPSVALATLGLTVMADGKAYAAPFSMRCWEKPSAKEDGPAFRAGPLLIQVQAGYLGSPSAR